MVQNGINPVFQSRWIVEWFNAAQKQQVESCQPRSCHFARSSPTWVFLTLEYVKFASHGIRWRCRTNHTRCYFIVLIPYHPTLDWNRKTSNFGKICNPRLPWRIRVLWSLDSSRDRCKSFSLPQVAVSVSASSGEDCCSLGGRPCSLQAWADPQSVPAAITCILCPSSHTREKRNWNPLQKWRGL